MEVASDGVWGGMAASNQHSFAWGSPLFVQGTLELGYSVWGSAVQLCLKTFVFLSVLSGPSPGC